MADKILRKLSIKTVTGLLVKDIRKWAEETPGKPIMTVMGVATGIQTGETDNGPWTALRGNFMAQNSKGERFRGGRAFIPDGGALDMVLGMLGDDSVENVKFAYNIFVREDNASVTGYTYVSEPLLEPAENDPLEAMISGLDTKMLAGSGPAPKAVENKSENADPKTAAKK